MIALFTDFGNEGFYTGQLEAVLRRDAPAAPIVSLMADAPALSPKPAAYLLAALVPEFEPGTVFLCVVDPGVGSDRPGCVLECDGRWFVGPANGLFEIVARRSGGLPAWREITWTPTRLSRSFHGRDLFAPVAARVWRGDLEGLAIRQEGSFRVREWPDDLPEIVYVDHFGNAVTGVRASSLPDRAGLEVRGRRVGRAGTFSDVPQGAVFFYENSNGLVEIAVNGGRAADLLDLEVGFPISLVGA